MGEGDASTALSTKEERSSACDGGSTNTANNVVDPQQITALHIALWNGSLTQIESSLQAPDALEAKDPRGHRALHLALKFAHRNSKAIVKRLLASGARVRSRDAEGWKAVHHAVASESEEILRLLIEREREQAPQFLNNKICDISPRLNQVPDFYCDLLIDVSTWLPGVSRFLPSDVVKIWKRGPDLRFDITLVGFENGSWQRGNLSFMLLGNEQKFISIDHEEREITDLLSAVQANDSTDFESMAHFLMTNSIMTTAVDATHVVFERKKSWLTKADVKENIGTWKQCDVFEMTGMFASLRIRKPQNKNHKPPASIAMADHERSAATSSALSMIEDAASDLYTEVVIDPKSNHVVSMELAVGEQVIWSFRLDTCDIGFNVRLLSESDREGEIWEDVIPMQRMDANGGKQYEGSFTAEHAGTIVLTWDNSYSKFRQKRLRFYLEVNADDSSKADTSTYDTDTNNHHHRACEQLMTFEEWFGLKIEYLPPALQQMGPKQRIMVHTQPPARTITKSFPATVYTTGEFPLSVHEFLPVIELLSKTTSVFENIQKFFTVNLADGFPVQFCFPLVPSISATCRFETMLLETPEASLFDIPQGYMRDDEGIRQEVLDHMSLV